MTYKIVNPAEMKSSTYGFLLVDSVAVVATFTVERSIDIGVLEVRQEDAVYHLTPLRARSMAAALLILADVAESAE